VFSTLKAGADTGRTAGYGFRTWELAAQACGIQGQFPSCSGAEDYQGAPEIMDLMKIVLLIGWLKP